MMSGSVDVMEKSKQILIISGKGGTGKTTVAMNLTRAIDSVVIADADVDSPDMHIIMQSNVVESFEKNFSKIADIDYSKCTNCGICEDLCRFDAIEYLEENKKYNIKENMCEGCGLCSAACKYGAIKLISVKTGDIYISDTTSGRLVHAALMPGGENSGKLVTAVKKYAETQSEKVAAKYMVIDGSPGIGCPVIASMSGTDYAILVTEPSISAFSDLRRVIELLEKMKIKYGIIINKFDINKNLTLKIKEYCKNIDVLAEIRYGHDIIEALNRKEFLYDVSKSYKKVFDDIAVKLLKKEVLCHAHSKKE